MAVVYSQNGVIVKRINYDFIDYITNTATGDDSYVEITNIPDIGNKIHILQEFTFYVNNIPSNSHSSRILDFTDAQIDIGNYQRHGAGYTPLNACFFIGMSVGGSTPNNNTSIKIILNKTISILGSYYNQDLFTVMRDDEIKECYTSNGNVASVNKATKIKFLHGMFNVEELHFKRMIYDGIIYRPAKSGTIYGVADNYGNFYPGHNITGV